MEMLGHSLIHVTADLYTHFTQAARREAANRIDAAVETGT